MHSPIKNLFLYLTLAILFLAAFTSANACSGGVNVCCGSGSVGCSGSICKACCGSTCGCFYKKSGGCNTQTTPCVDVNNPDFKPTNGQCKAQSKSLGSGSGLLGGILKSLEDGVEA